MKKKFEKELLEVYIIPAVFVGYREDGNVKLECLENGENTVVRAFEPNLINGVVNPKYLLLGITTGVNHMQLTLCDASEFEDLFKEKWSVLLK